MRRLSSMSAFGQKLASAAEFSRFATFLRTDILKAIFGPKKVVALARSFRWGSSLKKLELFLCEPGPPVRDKLAP
jgi:hypothetical protein